jgi:cytidylate kinase
MPAPLVTVTRQYASGGSEIARLVARDLGWTLVDNEFVNEVARRAGLPPDRVAQQEERTPGLLERLARTLAVASPEMFLAGGAGEGVPRLEADEATIVKMTERVIAEAAALGRAVLVGRGAQAILAQRQDALHVYVVAPRRFRERLAVEQLGVAPDAVANVLEETDGQRDRYVKTHYGRHRQDVTNYDMVLNTERLGIEGAAGLVLAEVRRRGWR